jgi:molybdopterin synthase sulfur carrier subunit
MNLRVLYFASLRDAAGTDSEQIAALNGDARALYAELSRRHGFTLAPERLRIAINGAFAPWERTLADGDEIAFLPPVSGG